MPPTKRRGIAVFLLSLVLGAIVGFLLPLRTTGTPPDSPGPLPVLPAESAGNAASAGSPGDAAGEPVDAARAAELAALRAELEGRRAAVAAASAPPASLEDLVSFAARRVREEGADPEFVWSQLGQLVEKALEREASRLGVELWELGFSSLNERLLLRFWAEAGRALPEEVRKAIEAQEREAAAFWEGYMAARGSRTRLERAAAGAGRAYRWMEALFELTAGGAPGEIDVVYAASRSSWNDLIREQPVREHETVEIVVDRELLEVGDPDERVRARPFVLAAAHEAIALQARFPQGAQRYWILEEQVEVLRILGALERQLLNEAHLSPESAKVLLRRYSR